MADLNAFYAGWTPRLLSVLRIISAFLFIAHGAQKLFGFLAPPGMPSFAPFSQMWIGGVVELDGFCEGLKVVGRGSPRHGARKGAVSRRWSRNHMSYDCWRSEMPPSVT